MSKCKVKIKDNQVFVRIKMNSDVTVCTNELELFNSKFIRGLMRPTVLNGKKIEYMAPANISLARYLASGITENDFFIVLAQFVECLKKIDWNGLNINNLILDTNHMFFNLTTREVQFIYQPLNCPKNRNNIYTFLFDLANQCVLALNESECFLSELVDFVRRQPMLSTSLLENYIVQHYPQAYKQVRRAKPGDSQSLQHTNRTYFEKKYDESGNTSTKESDGFGVYNQFAANDGVEQSKIDNLDSTCLLDKSQDTTVLEQNEGTVLLSPMEPLYPYLVRVNNYEKALINKPVFRIGKERSYVDYFVMSNNAVSRIHADIITKNNHVFIKDNDSTNHTFVNGTMIPPNVEIELHDGDAVMLANEPFEFHKE